MSIMDDLITDRTEADASLAERLDKLRWVDMTEQERETWLQDLKGAYNASDFNRVAAAVAYVTELLKADGITVDTQPVTSWQNGAAPDTPTAVQLERYRLDIVNLRAALKLAVTVPAAPASMSLTVEDANNIERILLAVEDAILRMRAAYIHANTTYSGMGGLRR